MSDEPRPKRNSAERACGRHSRELLIINKRGLQRGPRPSSCNGRKVNAEVWVTRGSETVGGTSIMGLMMLAAGREPPLRSRRGAGAQPRSSLAADRRQFHEEGT